MKLLLWIWILGLIVACTHPSERPPEVPDPQSSLTMVQKLETLLADKGLAAGERRLLTRRLADIYSDGARNFDGLEPTTSGQNCEPCKEAVAYRLKAVELYRQLLAGSGVAERSHLTEQILHLYEVTDRTAQAQRGYAEVIQTPSLYSSDLVRVAALGIADFQFNKSNYVRAERFYEQALNLDPKGLRIPYFYSRIAWCKFHQGRADLASQRMSSLLNSGIAIESSLKEDILRDYITFLAQTPFSAGRVAELEGLSAPDLRTANLRDFALELGRLGQKPGAIYVWKRLARLHVKHEDLIDDQVHLAQLAIDVGQSAEALVHFKSGLLSIQQPTKKLLLDWFSSQSKEPPAALETALSLYFKRFPDVEIALAGAEVARRRLHWREAVALYRFASDSNEKVASSQRLQEGAALGEIEVAELSKDPALKKQSYDHYLAKFPAGTKAYEVWYQRAYLDADLGFRQKAGAQFYALANMPTAPLALRKKAADRSLKVISPEDLLAAHSWALVFAQQFPDQKKEYQLIGRAALLKHETALLKKEAISQLELRQSLSRLLSADFSGATPEQGLGFNKLVIWVAERLRDLPTVTRAAENILNIEGRAASDTEFAKRKLEWVAELSFEFEKAYALAQSLKMVDLTPRERSLRLGLLAELSQNDPTRHYRDYLAGRIVKVGDNERLVASRLVLESETPQREYRARESILKTAPELEADIALRVFLKTRDTKFASYALSGHRLLKGPSRQALFREVYWIENSPYLDRQSQRISEWDATSASSLTESFLRRVRRIKSFESRIQDALTSGDIFVQIWALKSAQGISQDFGTVLSHVQRPKDLAKSVWVKTQALLSKQSIYYLNRAREMGQKLNDLWDPKVQEKFVQSLWGSQEQIRKVLISECQRVFGALSDEKRKGLEAALQPFSKGTPAVDLAVLRAAQLAAKSNPFGTTELERLKDLEGTAGHEIVVSYLDARLERIRKEARHE